MDPLPFTFLIRSPCVTEPSHAHALNQAWIAWHEMVHTQTLARLDQGIRMCLRRRFLSDCIASHASFQA